MDCCLPGSSVHGILQQEYWSALPFPPPGYLPNPGIKPSLSLSPGSVDRFFTTKPPGMSHRWLVNNRNSSLTFLKFEMSKIKAQGNSVSNEAVSLFIDATFSMWPHMVEAVRELLSLYTFYKTPQFQMSHLLISSHWGVKFQHMNLRLMANIQSIAMVYI